MVEKQCLYITDINSTGSSIGLTSANKVSPRIQSRSGNGESIKVELVPVLPDNTCPPGTENSEYGLCRKTVRPVVAKRPCPDNYELIKGKCTHKTVKVPTRSESTTIASNIDMLESTTFVEKPIRKGEFIKSTTESLISGEPNIELQSETTTVPL